MISTSQIAVTDTAAQLPSVGADASVAIRNTGSADVYLGGSDVTTDNGFLLAAGETACIELASPYFANNNALYAVSATSSTIAVLTATA